MNIRKLLEDAGVPIGPIRPRPLALDPFLVGAAVSDLAFGRTQLDEGDREPLLAWLRAWRHHWPASFRAILGESGERLAARLEAEPVDVNRYLKLRRIAIENLAGVL